MGGGAGSLTIARGVVGQRTSFSRPFIVSTSSHDYRVYEGGRCQGGLTQRTEFQFLDGKGALSLFLCRSAAEAGAPAGLGWRVGCEALSLGHGRWPRAGAGGARGRGSEPLPGEEAGSSHPARAGGLARTCGQRPRGRQGRATRGLLSSKTGSMSGVKPHRGCAASGQWVAGGNVAAGRTGEEVEVDLGRREEGQQPQEPQPWPLRRQGHSSL